MEKSQQLLISLAMGLLNLVGARESNAQVDPFLCTS